VALQTIYGVGSILACHVLAELGEAARFRRARQAVRAAGLDPVVDESGETRRRGRLAKHGAPVLRWALVEAAQHAQRANSPDRGLYTQAYDARRQQARGAHGRAQDRPSRLPRPQRAVSFVRCPRRVDRGV
jgi:transposase